MRNVEERLKQYSEKDLEVIKHGLYTQRRNAGEEILSHLGTAKAQEVIDRWSGFNSLEKKINSVISEKAFRRLYMGFKKR